MLFSYIVWVREAATFWKEPDVLIKKKRRLELQKLNFQCWKKEADPPPPASSSPSLCCDAVPRALRSPSLSRDVISSKKQSFPDTPYHMLFIFLL